MAIDFPIVALGSSAGGLEPMQAFFRTVPPDTSLGFVGRVSIDWTTEQGESGEWLVIYWQESDGPAVVPHGGSGYGTTLIEREVEYELDGTVELRFDHDGVSAALKIPMQSHFISGPGATAPAADC